jgi:hypothetical protein
MGFKIYNRALTSTEVLADYTALAPIVARGDCIDRIPYLWTDDGDSVLSLDTGKQPLGVVAGVPGNAPAITEIHTSVSTFVSTMGPIVLSNDVSNKNVRLTNYLTDVSGSAISGAYGGSVNTTSVTSAGQQISYGYLQSVESQEFSNKQYYLYLRARATTAGTVTLYSKLYLNSHEILSLGKTVTMGTAFRSYITPPLVFPDFTKFTGQVGDSVQLDVFGQVSSGTLVVNVDYMAVLPDPVTILTPKSNDGLSVFAYKDDLSFSGFSLNPFLSGMPISIIGRTMEFQPNKQNHLQCYFGADGTIDPLTTFAATVSSLYLTPRWALL